MRISQYFGLEKDQPELDFVDVPAFGDIPLFLDPYAISLGSDPWFVECHKAIHSFFGLILELIRRGSDGRARELLLRLREPNETHLGLSKGTPSGRGVGPGQSEQIFDRLGASKAVRTGFLRDLSDCELVIPGISRDKISDVTTNIIRYFLIEYTKSQCLLYGIRTRKVSSGFYWDPNEMEWRNSYVDLPIIGSSRLLLTPKALVRFDLVYNHREYYDNFVLDYLQAEHLEAGTALVKALKSGARRVYKKDLKKAHPLSKDFIFKFSLEHPHVFDDYKESLPKEIEFLTDSEIEAVQDESIEHDVSELISALEEIRTGSEDASKYHSLIIGILEAIFYPQIYKPVKEQEIHEGRKRIDIVFNNGGREGFFRDLVMLHRMHAPYVMFECKNYSSDPRNPEFDQLTGRFSRERGKFGIMVCRHVENKELMLKRCKDVLNDGRGFVIVLDDDDIIELLRIKSSGDEASISDYMDNKYRGIIF